MHHPEPPTLRCAQLALAAYLFGWRLAYISVTLEFFGYYSSTRISLAIRRINSMTSAVTDRVWSLGNEQPKRVSVLWIETKPG